MISFRLSIVLIAAVVTLNSSLASEAKSRIRIVWRSNCDYRGGDINSAKGHPHACSSLCVNNQNCFRWSWTHYNGGTCWLKGADVQPVGTRGGSCGYIVRQPSATTTTTTTTKTRPSKKAPRPSTTDFENGLTMAQNAEMLASINSHRARHGLGALTIDSQLVAAALEHSQDQASHCTMTHDGTDGTEPWDRIEAQGYSWSVVAENVAAGQMSVTEVMESWWESKGHRENILKDDVENIGFALANNKACDLTTYWTQNFGTKQDD